MNVHAKVKAAKPAKVRPPTPKAPQPSDAEVQAFLETDFEPWSRDFPNSIRWDEWNRTYGMWVRMASTVLIQSKAELIETMRSILTLDNEPAGMLAGMRETREFLEVLRETLQAAMGRLIMVEALVTSEEARP